MAANPEELTFWGNSWSEFRQDIVVIGFLTKHMESQFWGLLPCKGGIACEQQHDNSIQLFLAICC